MKKTIIKLRIFFLMAAMVAICAHMVIPHDHHPAESVASDEESCPASHNNTTHHNNFPVHCHACNDLTSEKAIHQIITRNIQHNFFIVSNLMDLSGKGQYNNVHFISGFTSPLHKTDPQNLNLLRAPPSFI